jgi:diguanylate cyclase (GGDEF)-like protein/PAS domain S-box-containing protein
MRIQAEANLSALIESTADLIWSVDPRLRLITFNRAFKEYFERNYGGPVAPGMSFRELLPPELAVFWLPLYERALSGNQFSAEHTIADGRTLEISFSPIVADGETTGVSVFGKNITERKKAESALRVAEADLTALIESTRDLVWSVDLNYRLTTFNGALRQNIEETFGIRLAMGMRHYEVLPPERAALWPSFYARAISDGPFRVEYSLISPSILELAFNPIVVDGIITGVSVFGKDITDRKRAEQALQESETRFRNFFEENGTVMFLVVPETGEFVYVNRAACEFYGYPRERLIGMFTRQISLSAPEEIARDRQRALRKECSCFYYSHRLASGEVREIELHSSPFEVDGRQMLCAIVNDITERKRAEQALQESETRFRNFFEQNGTVMILVVPETGEIAAANRAASKYYGYSREQLIGMNVNRFNTLPPHEVALEQQRAFSEERNFFNFRHRLASGEEREVEVYSSPVEANGRRLLFSIVHDVTDRRRAEEELRESSDFLKEAQRIGDLGCYVLDVPSGVWTSTSRLDEIFGIDDRYPRTVEGWEALVHPADQAMMAAYFAGEVIGDGRPFDKEYRIVRQTDQAERWVRGQGKLDFDEQGKPFKMRGIISDVTVHRQWEMQLQDSEERYRATFEQAAVGIVHASFEGHILHCNTCFAGMLGYTTEEISDKTIGQITAPEDCAANIAALNRIRHGDASSEILEKRYIRKDGSLCWTKLTISLMCDGAGNPLHYIAVAEDINARKAIEQSLAAVQETLRLSEERYRTVFETSSDAVLIAQLSDGIIIDANQALLDAGRYERNEVIGHTTEELGIWVNAGDRRKLLDLILQNDSCRNLEILFKRKDGETLWMRLSASLIEVGGCACTLTFAHDISAAKAAQDLLTAAAEALRLSEERYRTAFQTSIDAININRMDDGKYLDCNQAFLDVMGYEREEVIGKTSLQLGVWADPHDRMTMANQVKENGSFRGLEVQFRKKSGELFWGVISASAMEVDGVPCILSITRDLSEVKAAQNEIRSLAYYDPLTGLPNRRLLLERLRQSLAAGSPDGRLRALLFVELDNFKMLNETIGHITGDLLLMGVARRIVTCAREADIVSRFGGDEFALMLEDLSEIAEEAAAQAKAVAEKIQDSICLPFQLEGREYLTTASIGITVFGADREGASELIQEADIAIYQATTAGRNTIRFFSPALQAAVNARATLEEDLRQAIKARQFLLYYQPLVARGRLIGAEALIRWQHPTRGLVWPGEFIPLAEETGLILPLGDWVLEAACEQLAAWAGHQQSAHLSLAVNISALQFRQPGFVATVLSALERSGANPKHLKLELTESMLVENIEEIIAKMTELKAHGLSFSLDDFGTGYSSLAYLKRLPLSLLKIDRAFVRDMLVDATSGAIAQTIISLGRAMGLSVIAEGVENEEQRGFLAGLGCHTFQGFLFSPPLPLVQFEALLML